MLKLRLLEFAVEFAAVENPDDGLFAFQETGFALEHLRTDIATADFADGECLDACCHGNVRADVGTIRFALAYVAVTDNDEGRFF